MICRRRVAAIESPLLIGWAVDAWGTDWEHFPFLWGLFRAAFMDHSSLESLSDTIFSKGSPNLLLSSSDTEPPTWGRPRGSCARKTRARTQLKSRGRSRIVRRGSWVLRGG